MPIDLITDILRWWAVPAAMISIVEIKGQLPVLRKALIEKSLVQPVDLTRAFFTALALLLMSLAIVIAGAIIPVFTDGRIFGLGPDTPFYSYGMGIAWLLWSTSSWGLAASFAHRRTPIFISGGLWLVAVCIALEVLPVAAK